jgi:hypothetical protein
MRTGKKIMQKAFFLKKKLKFILILTIHRKFNIMKNNLNLKLDNTHFKVLKKIIK